MDVDEVAFTTLVAEGVDVPTAYAASIDSDPVPATDQNRGFGLGLIVGVLFYWVWLI